MKPNLEELNQRSVPAAYGPEVAQHQESVHADVAHVLEPKHEASAEAGHGLDHDALHAIAELAEKDTHDRLHAEAHKRGHAILEKAETDLQAIEAGHKHGGGHGHAEGDHGHVFHGAEVGHADGAHSGHAAHAEHQHNPADEAIEEAKDHRNEHADVEHGVFVGVEGHDAEGAHGGTAAHGTGGHKAEGSEAHGQTHAHTGGAEHQDAAHEAGAASGHHAEGHTDEQLVALQASVAGAVATAVTATDAYPDVFIDDDNRNVQVAEDELEAGASVDDNQKLIGTEISEVMHGVYVDG